MIQTLKTLPYKRQIMISSKITDQIRQQLSTRYKTQNKTIYENEKPSEVIFLLSPSDVGVTRNGGRQGAFYGPKVIMNELAKFQKTSHHIHSINRCTVTNLKEELEHFEEAQLSQATRIKDCLKDQLPAIHLGGGHDHIFSFLVAIEQRFSNKKINIINIDAHLDTRQDTAPHSGTPFRQYDQTTQKKYELHQIGIHLETNSSENYKDLKMTSMKISPLKRPIHHAQSLSELVKNSIKSTTEWINILSIDLDALDSSQFKSCSAVNPEGFFLNELGSIISSYVNEVGKNIFIGFYEYNPLYDDLSNSDGKKIAWQINQILKLIK